MEKTLKELVKEAVLEALIEFSNGGVAATADSGFEGGMDDGTDLNDPTVPGTGDNGDGGDNGNGDDGTGNGDDDDKKKDPIRPKPVIPPAGF